MGEGEAWEEYRSYTSHAPPSPPASLPPTLLILPKLLGEGDCGVHGGFGLGFERHVGFAEIFVAFFMIAGFTGDRDVIPGVCATFGTGNDVIDRQCSGATAILAPMSVAAE